MQANDTRDYLDSLIHAALDTQAPATIREMTDWVVTNLDDRQVSMQEVLEIAVESEVRRHVRRRSLNPHQSPSVL